MLFLMHLLLQKLLYTLHYYWNYYHIQYFLLFSFQIVIITFYLIFLSLSLFNSAIKGISYLILVLFGLALITWSVCIVSSHILFKESFPTTSSGSCLYYFSFISKPIFLHTSQCIFLHTKSCLLLCPLCANIGHSHNVSHCLIHFTTQSTLTLSLSLVYFCIYCLCPNGLSFSAKISDSVSFFGGHLHRTYVQRGEGRGQTQCIRLCARAEGGFQGCILTQKTKSFLDHKISKLFSFLYKRSYYIGIYYCV